MNFLLQKYYTSSLLKGNKYHLSYISDVNEIGNDLLEQMKQQAVDTYNAHIANDWDEFITLEDFEFIATYLLTLKDESVVSYVQNELILVYKAKSKIDYADGVGTFEKEQDVYWYLAYDNIVADKDGKVVVDIEEVAHLMLNKLLDLTA